MRNLKTYLALTILSLFLSFVLINTASYAKNIESRKFNMKHSNKSSYKTKSKAGTSKIKGREIVIKVKDSSSFDISGLNITSLNKTSLKKNGFVVVKVPESENFDSILEELNSQSDIEYAEPNYIYKLSAITPNDTYYSNQWYLSKINMPSTWTSYQGSSDITVAVIDTGIDKTHADLQGRFLQGYDFVDNDTSPTDGYGHGTMVSGIIAANANNSKGITGIDWNCKIMPLKVSDASGNLDSAAIIEAIYYAKNNGADVINMSFGGTSGSEALYEALYEAYDAGIVLVAAAGNETSTVSYPAAYPFVISAASTNSSDALSSFSNHDYTLDIAAPGENMYTTSLGSSYQSVNGTSFSSPTIASVAALILGKNSNLTPSEVEWLIEDTAYMPSSYGSSERNYELGYGRVDAYAALTQSLPTLTDETGDSYSAAKTISFNQTYSDLFETPMDEDWFNFQVPSSTTSASLAINVPDSIDAYAELYKYNTSTHNLQLVNIIDEGYTGENESASLSLSSGTYYLRVYEYYAHWSCDNYSINITAAKTLSNITASTSSIYLPESSDYSMPITATYTDGSTANISEDVSSTSSKTSVATVDGCIISAVSSGNANITFTYGSKSTAVKVYVTPQISSLSSDVSSVSLESGKRSSIRLTAAYTNGRTENVSKKATWSSSNESVATVSQGTVTAVSSGTATITATFGESQATISVTVTPKLLSISADNSSISLESGENSTPVITAIFQGGEPSNVTSECTWSSSKTQVATVSSSGTITAGSKGTSKITVKYGTKKLSISVTVTPVLESICFDEDEATVYIGKTIKAKAYAKYVGDNKKYDVTKSVSSWESSNGSIATVSSGAVSGLAVGDTEITAQYLGEEASITIHVQRELSKLIIQVNSKTMSAGQSQSITVVADFKAGDDEDVTDEAVITSSNTDAVTIDSDILDAIAKGKSKITATWGGKNATVKITVTT